MTGDEFPMTDEQRQSGRAAIAEARALLDSLRQAS
jgi:hypothetical protein